MYAIRSYYEMLTIGAVALSLDKSLLVHYDADPGHNPPGCLPGDCRLLLGLRVQK